jgi:hypothetical protein
MWSQGKPEGSGNKLVILAAEEAPISCKP